MKQTAQQTAEGILFTDQYQLTMAQLYFRLGLHEKPVQFDHFFRVCWLLYSSIEIEEVIRLLSFDLRKFRTTKWLKNDHHKQTEHWKDNYTQRPVIKSGNIDNLKKPSTNRWWLAPLLG